MLDSSVFQEISMSAGHYFFKKRKEPAFIPITLWTFSNLGKDQVVFRISNKPLLRILPFAVCSF